MQRSRDIHVRRNYVQNRYGTFVQGAINNVQRSLWIRLQTLAMRAQAVVILAIFSLVFAFDGSWQGLPLPHTDLGAPGASILGNSTIRAGFYVRGSGNTAYCATALDQRCKSGLDELIKVDLSVSIPVRCPSTTSVSDAAVTQIQLVQRGLVLSLPEGRNRAVPSSTTNDPATYHFEYQVPSGRCSTGNLILDYGSRPITFALTYSRFDLPAIFKK